MIKTMKLSKSLQSIWMRVVVWLLLNISPSNVFQKMLLLVKYFQNGQASFGLRMGLECQHVKLFHLGPFRNKLVTWVSTEPKPHTDPDHPGALHTLVWLTRADLVTPTLHPGNPVCDILGHSQLASFNPLMTWTIRRPFFFTLVWPIILILVCSTGTVYLPIPRLASFRYFRPFLSIHFFTRLSNIYVNLSPTRSLQWTE